MAPGESERDDAIKRLKAKRAFRGNVASYVLVNIFLVGIWAATGAGFFWPVFTILGWGIGIATHAWQVYGQKGISEDDVAREIERGGRTIS